MDQLPCRHLGDVNHAPSLVAGFAELEFLVLGDDFHVPFYCEDSFPSHLSVEMSSSLSFSFSSSSGGVPPVPGFVDYLSSVLTTRIWWQVMMFLAAVWCHFLQDWAPVQNSLCPSELSSEVYFGQLCWVLSLVREVRLPVGTVHSRFKKA